MGMPTDAEIERHRINQAERDIVTAEENWKEQRIEELEAALRSVMIGGNHVALLIGVPHPPHTATHDEARSFYSMQEQYEAWCCWRTIMHARDVLGD